MTASVEFWFEFASTYSYPAAHRIEREANARGIPVKWRSFLLAPIFGAQGWNDSPFNIYPAKGKYMWRDLARICANEGLPLKRPSHFPRNGLLAARIVSAFPEADWLPGFVKSVYSANFAADEDISFPAILGNILKALGQKPDAVLAAAAAQENKDHFRRQTDDAIARGVFGSPSFVVDGELFWGNDRLDAALDWAEGNRAAVAL